MSPSSLLVVHWNARGLIPSLLEFKSFLSSRPVSLAFVCETFLSASRPLSVPGFTVLRLDAVRPLCGGFACFVADSLSPFLSPLPLPPLPDPSFTAFSLSSPALSLVSVYLPPLSPLSLLDSLASFLRSLPSPVLVVGDFNAHHPAWGSPRSCPRGALLHDLLEDLGLVLLNTGAPTYCAAHTGAPSHLDLAFCSPSLVGISSWNVHDDALGSDHFPCLINLTSQPPCPTFDSSPHWITRNGGWDLFTHFVEEAVADLCVPCDNIDRCYSNFVLAVTRAADKAFRRRRPGTSRRSLVPWWTEACATAVKSKRQAYRDFRRKGTHDLLIRYKRLCAISRRVIRQAQRSSWRAFCSSLSRTTPLADVWRRVNAVRFNSSRGHPVLPSLPLHSKFSALAAHFTSDIAASVLDSDRIDDMTMLVNSHLIIPCPCTSPLCSPFTIHELNTALDHLRNSAPGHDGIPPAFLTHLSTQARQSLLAIFNLSWRTGTIPNDWRCSIVIPLPKSSNYPDNPGSYRPISLTPAASRLMERMILTRLDWFTACTQILSPHQHGFRQGHSTLHNHTILEHDIRSAFDSRRSTLVCFLDIKSAFDTVWHTGLLRKLQMYNFPRCTINWIRDFLSGRSFRLRIAGHHSDPFPTTAGTPQGCVLSPLLFSIMLNDLPDCLPPGIHISLFADDIAIWTCGKDFPVMGCHLQDALDILEDWADDWGFAFAPSKSVVVPFTLQQSFQLEFSLTIGEARIPNSVEHRYLGVTFDRKLTWRPHLLTVSTAVFRRLNLLRHISGRSWGADRDSMLLLYRTLIQPFFDFGAPLFLNASSSFYQQLSKLQASCLRLCLGLLRSTPHLALQVEAGIPPLLIRFKYLSARFFARTVTRCHDSPLLTTLLAYLGDHRYTWNRTPSGAFSLTRLIDCPRNTLPRLTPRSDLFTPVWMLLPPTIVIPALPSKATTSPEVLRALFLEAIAPYRRHSTLLYTDGSYSPDSGYSASSFCIPSLNTTFSCRLPDYTGIYTAELFAILCAIKHIHEHSLSPTVIFSDSMSAVTALASFSSARSADDWTLLARIRLELHIAKLHDLHIVIHWVPGHIGIEGNEEADRLAATAARSNFLDVPCSLRAQLSVFSSSLQTAWQRDWDASSKCRSLFNIKRPVERWPHFSFGPRPLTTALARLRTGHTLLHEPAHRHGLAASPACRFCGSPETVSHFLEQCPSLAHLRATILQPTISTIPSAALSSKYLLSGGDPPFAHHRAIFRALWSYIQASGVYV